MQHSPLCLNSDGHTNLCILQRSPWSTGPVRCFSSSSSSSSRLQSVTQLPAKHLSFWMSKSLGHVFSKIFHSPHRKHIPGGFIPKIKNSQNTSERPIEMTFYHSTGRCWDSMSQVCFVGSRSLRDRGPTHLPVLSETGDCVDPAGFCGSVSRCRARSLPESGCLTVSCV